MTSRGRVITTKLLPLPRVAVARRRFDEKLPGRNRLEDGRHETYKIENEITQRLNANQIQTGRNQREFINLSRTKHPTEGVSIRHVVTFRRASAPAGPNAADPPALVLPRGADATARNPVRLGEPRRFLIAGLDKTTISGPPLEEPEPTESIMQ